MECTICTNALSAKRKAICASCARAKIYGSRIEQAAGLLGREKAHAHVQAIVRPGNDGILAALPEDADWDAITAGMKYDGVVRAKEERLAVESRIKDIAEKAEQLKREMQEYKALITSRKEANENRRKQLEASQVHLEKDKKRVTEPVHAATRKARHRLNKVHTRTIEAREYLCQEASSLSRLKKIRLLDNRTQFLLRGIPLPSLRELNGLKDRLKSETIDQSSGPKLLTDPHEVISAAMDNICRFLGICCHYLSIRLPAEIILPHNGFPHAVILPIGSSYKRDISVYQGIVSSNPEASRTNLQQEVSLPRTLQLDRPLPQLQKEDPRAAALFIEGVSLLAYNLAWLCRTQGLAPLNSFEELCDLGQNLHSLFPSKDSKDRRPSLSRNNSSTTAKPDPTRSVAETDDGKGKLRFGSHSHATLRNSLVSEDSLPEWKYSITKLVDQLKAYLRNEVARAEWHIIDDKEWDEEVEYERPVFVGGQKRGVAESVLSVKPSDGDEEGSPFAGKGVGVGGGRGNSGWTKVKGRAGDG